jgi:hypothetical protein
MDAPVIAAIVAASATAVGWFVTNIANTISNRRTLRESVTLKYIERQLEELYGPLHFLILEGRQTFKELLASLGRRNVFLEGKSLSESDLKTWLFWVENDLFPRNEKIKALLASKAHLYATREVPASYLAFLDHHNSWYINHLRWKQEGISYSWHSKVNWPLEFALEIGKTFENLKERYAKLLSRRE